MHIDTRLLRHVDKLLLLSMIGLLVMGFIVISSAAQGFSGQEEASGFIKKQMIAVVIGVVGMLILLLFDYNEFGRMSKVIYAVNAGLLILVFALGAVTNGSQRWIQLGSSFHVEPSEYGKIMLIVTLGYHLTRVENLKSIWDLFWPAIHVLPLVALILIQPNLGTAIIFLVITAALVYMAGFPGWKLVLLGGGPVATISAWVFAHLRWGVPLPLFDHQVDRILDFIDPTRDPLGSGYQVIQSKISIGSGGLYGKGLYEGTQNQLGFLPEQHTDFVFSVVGEELGFVGGVLLLSLFLLMLWRIMTIAATAKDLYGSLIATGVAVMIGFHVVQNVGMTLGLMPVTGITLPFVSYGGTSIMTNIIAIGLVLNVGMRRHTLMF